MCIICASKSGVRQPKDTELMNMFAANSHGAGYMYARNGNVTIHKGFMDVDEFLNAVHAEEFTERDSVVYHFRISTQAGVNPEMTHPFPLTNHPRYMRALDVMCGIGVAHNGIICLTSDPDNNMYSDTAVFITEYLYKIIRSSEDLRDQQVLNHVYQLAQSKFAIMDGEGYIATVGNFIDEDGLLFSNGSYLDYDPRIRYRKPALVR